MRTVPARDKNVAKCEASPSTPGDKPSSTSSVRNLVQKDIEDPLDRPRTLAVDNPHHIVRNVTDKTLHSVPQRKTYSMVQDKRVLDASTGMTYPYGYRPTQNMVDDMILNILFSDIDSALDDMEEDLPCISELCQ